MSVGTAGIAAAFGALSGGLFSGGLHAISGTIISNVDVPSIYESHSFMVHEKELKLYLYLTKGLVVFSNLSILLLLFFCSENLFSKRLSIQYV